MLENTSSGSRQVARVAIGLALTDSREQEKQYKDALSANMHATAVDYGGEYITSITKVVERAVVAARRENIIKETHLEEGAVAGATHDALMQISQKTIGLNIGGKIAIARDGEHVAVAVFFGVGLLHLNDVAIGLGHRVV